MEVALVEVLVPRVAVRVELHERQRAVLLCDHAQLGQRDRVVAAEREREDARVDDRREPLLDAPVRPLGVARRDGQVAVVDDRERLAEIDAEPRVVRAEQRRRGADRLRPEARARPIRDRGVERNPVDGGVDAGELRHVREPHEGPHAGEAWVDARVDRAIRRPRHAADSCAIASAGSRG